MVDEPKNFTEQLHRISIAAPPPFYSRCECGYETYVDTKRCKWKRNSEEVRTEYIGTEVICVACKMPKQWRWECHYGN